MRKLSYLAAPYSDPNPNLIHVRMQKFYSTTAQLAERKFDIVSPLFMHAALPFGKLGSDWNFWESHSRLLMSKCDEVIVLMLPGWESSKGVQEEIRMARLFGLPVGYVSMDHEMRIGAIRYEDRAEKIQDRQAALV